MSFLDKLGLGKKTSPKQLSNTIKDILKRNDSDEINNLSLILSQANLTLGEARLKSVNNALGDKAPALQPSKPVYTAKYDSTKTVETIIKEVAEHGDDNEIASLELYLITAQQDIIQTVNKNAKDFFSTQLEFGK